MWLTPQRTFVDNIDFLFRILLRKIMNHRCPVMVAVRMYPYAYYSMCFLIRLMFPLTNPIASTLHSEALFTC